MSYSYIVDRGYDDSKCPLHFLMDYPFHQRCHHVATSSLNFDLHGFHYYFLVTLCTYPSYTPHDGCLKQNRDSPLYAASSTIPRSNRILAYPLSFPYLHEMGSQNGAYHQTHSVSPQLSKPTRRTCLTKSDPQGPRHKRENVDIKSYIADPRRRRCSATLAKYYRRA